MENPNAESRTQMDPYKRAEDNMLAAVQEQREFFLRVVQRFETLLKSITEELDRKKAEKSKNGTSTTTTTTSTATTTSTTSSHVDSDERKEVEEKKEEKREEKKQEDEVEALERRLKLVLGLFHTVGRKYHKELRALREMTDLLLSNTHPLVATVYSKFKALEIQY